MSHTPNSFWYLAGYTGVAIRVPERMYWGVVAHPPPSFRYLAGYTGVAIRVPERMYWGEVAAG